MSRDFRAQPEADFKEALRACQWNYMGNDLWQKGRSRIFVDDRGIFLYRLLAGAWVRTAGLAHELIKSTHLAERMVHFPDFEINLLMED